MGKAQVLFLTVLLIISVSLNDIISAVLNLFIFEMRLNLYILKAFFPALRVFVTIPVGPFSFLPLLPLLISTPLTLIIFPDYESVYSNMHLF